MSRKIFLVTLLFAGSAFAGDRAFQTSVARDGVRRVVIALRAGDVKVRNGAAGSISVHGSVHRDRTDVNDLDRLVPGITVNGDVAIIQPVSSGRFRHGWNVNYDVVVEVPEGTSLKFESAAGEFNLDGSFGDVDLNIWAGDITMRSPRAAVRELSASVRVGEVHTNFPDRSVDREGVLPGTTWYANATGRGKVYLHAMAGDVKVDLR